MSLLSSTQGTPERVWSALGALEAHGGRLEHVEFLRWLNPRFSLKAGLRTLGGDADDQTVGAAMSLGFVRKEGSESMLGVSCPANYGAFADLVHDRLCSIDGDDPDAVLFEVFAWIATEVEAQQSTGWIGSAQNDQFADAADLGIGARPDRQGMRRFNATKVTPWRRWMTFLGLAADFPRGLGFYPYVADRLSRELSRSGMRTGEEVPIATVLEIVARRMPYLDGGRMFEAASARRENAPQGRRLSAILSIALRDLHDEGGLELRVRGDATDLRDLSRDDLHAVKSVQTIVLKERSGD